MNKFLVVFLFLIALHIGAEPLSIHVICYRNGVGLNRDIDILSKELSALGHNVKFIASYDKTPLPHADINIFNDVVEDYFFQFADKNYLIPNPDWCFLSAEQIARFDKILCKTKEGERIFKPLNPNTVLMGFTSKDCDDPAIVKNYKQPIHIVGASIQKGTENVTQTWVRYPHLPLLTILRHKGDALIPSVKNIQLISEYLTDSSLSQYQNSYAMHICPSETEGFGHYMMEALSCGNIVVTTDAPPMNEFVHDQRCLVKYNRSEPWRWAIRYFIDPTSLNTVVEHLLNLPDEELKNIGRANREFYLKNDQIFKRRLAEIFINQSKWGKTDLIWNLGLASQSDSGIDKDPRHFFSNYYHEQMSSILPNHLKAGDVVWMRTREVPKFFQEVFPKVLVPIILLISDGDESFPSAIANRMDVEALLNDNRIYHVFAQNCDYKGPNANKISFVPIGLDFHTAAYSRTFWGESGSPEKQEKVLLDILKTASSPKERKMRAFVDFQHADSIRDGDCKRYLELGENRTGIFQRLLQTGLIDHGKTMNRADLWKTKAQYAFSISPHGNGLDCHRTWEDLALGCIVIVKHSSLDPLYEGLPVAIVKDWSEINELQMQRWIEQYGDTLSNPSYRERLTNTYWIKKIQTKKNQLLESTQNNRSLTVTGIP